MDKNDAIIVEGLVEYIRDNRELRAVIKELQEKVVFANGRTTAAHKDFEGARRAQDKLQAELETVKGYLASANKTCAELIIERDDLAGRLKEGYAEREHNFRVGQQLQQERDLAQRDLARTTLERDNAAKLRDLLADRVREHQAHLQEIMQERDAARNELTEMRQSIGVHATSTMPDNNPIAQDYP